MDIFLKAINRRGSEFELHEHFARILHNPPYLARPSDTPVNFRVRFTRDRKGRPRMAILTISDVAVAEALLRAQSTVPPFQGTRIGMQRSNRPLDKVLLNLLQSTPYEGPGPLQRLQEARDRLAAVINFDTLAFGWIDRDNTYSIEWKTQCREGSLSFDALNSTIEVQFAQNPSSDDSLESMLRSLSLRTVLNHISCPFRQLDSLRHLATTETAYIEITFKVPPVFSTVTTMLQDDPVHKRVRATAIGLPRRKVGFISLAMILTLRSPFQSALKSFKEMARYINCESVPMQLPPAKRHHFQLSCLDDIEGWISTFPWPASFHCASLLHNWLLSAKELRDIRPFIKESTSDMSGDTLERFFEYLAMNLRSMIGDRIQPGPEAGEKIRDSLESCVREAEQSARIRLPYQSAQFSCLSVKVTPTRIVLEGPFPEQSNRVLRNYAGNEDAFIRVHLTDEDEHPLRIGGDMDHGQLVRDIVCQTLKNPLSIAGRKFKFLAYSNSALKQHSVWFVADFVDPRLGLVTASTIRRTLGNFDKIITCPARVGARMSQAFTSTDPTIIAENIESIRDITSEFYDHRTGKVRSINFTDGIGTISRETAENITSVLEARSMVKRRQQMMNVHSAFQIRLGGHKGMLSVDYTQRGSAIRIRDSMTKFISEDFKSIEVAQTFERPKPAYLNRPLIMILETLGVRIDVFERLQSGTISSVQAAASTLVGAHTLLQKYNFGRALKVTKVLSGLHKLGFRDNVNDFFRRAMDCVVYDILRALKYQARILLPNSFTLVGVADVHGYLKEGEIFACVQEEGCDPIYLRGRTLITRSPCIHPGDVQIVKAIGRPPPGSPFIHEPLTNCVVFPCQGTHSLPQSLGGGDLDGDEYSLIQVPELFPPRTVDPADYEPVVLKHLDEGRQCNLDTNEEVADFVADFIIHDILGIIATRNLIIADQSDRMSEDPDCLFLAKLASQAVDFQKSGTPAKYTMLPKERSQLKPDWYIGEQGREQDTYPSPHALGALYRAIELGYMDVPTSGRGNHDLDRVLGASRNKDVFLTSLRSPALLRDPLSSKLFLYLRMHGCRFILDKSLVYAETLPTMQHFSYRMRNLSYRMSLTSRPLSEEECWAGAILDHSRLPKVRRDRQADLVDRLSRLCEETRGMLINAAQGAHGRLDQYWAAWVVARHCSSKGVFGANCFQFLVLGEIFAYLDV
ncbi:RNA dependent RNA polymerase-domain-containing protein [Cantharellus anzutake]|uniref:RNA dependent RNA polymerase-domain-containing protein n=1 Tax=Cantharellus anzutake TaxID=1750568 RepID=UPI001908DB36|nr:RNA dependent RNA polymerase-domain-containing protein [Cantharellus anzutake]KAF8316012.1 RNA dependent RNA polymerase-domain-containing protein [Cantharellus anzutake]